MNKNSNNKTALQEFVQATSEVKANLKERYGESWVDPNTSSEDVELLKQQGQEEVAKNIEKRFMTTEYEDVDPTPQEKKEAEEEQPSDHRV